MKNDAKLRSTTSKCLPERQSSDNPNPTSSRRGTVQKIDNDKSYRKKRKSEEENNFKYRQSKQSTLTPFKLVCLRFK